MATNVNTLTLPSRSDPNQVIIGRATDNLDMDEAWYLADGLYRLVYLRVHFTDLSGSATGTATLTVSQFDTALGATGYYDATLWKASGVSAVGIGTDFTLRVTDANIWHYPWTFDGAGGYAVRLVWTNPDSTNIQWGVEIGCALV